MRLGLVLLVIGCRHPEPVDSKPVDGRFTFRAQVERARTVSDDADSVLAIPHQRGAVAPAASTAVVLAPIAVDGTFELELGTASDWSLYLVDTDAQDPRLRVIRRLALGLDASELLTISGSRVTGDIDGGTLNDEGDTVSTDTTTVEVADWFELEAASLDALGAADDVLAGLSNAAANANGGERYWAGASFSWWADASAPWVSPVVPPYTFNGFGIDVGGIGGPVDVDRIGSGEQTAVLRPPAEVTINNVVYGPDAPLTPRWSSTGEDGSFRLSFTDHEPNWGTIEGYSAFPAGWWSLEVDGVEVAAFDLALAIPMDEQGLPIGLYPTLAMDAPASDGALDQAHVAWRLRNAVTGDDAPVEAAMVAPIVAGAGVKVESRVDGTGDLASFEVQGTADGGPPEDVDLGGLYHAFAMPDAPGGVPILTSVQVFTGIGDSQAWLGFLDLTCQDRDHDQVSRCVEGAAYDDDPTVYPGAPELCGDGADNGLDGGGDATCVLDVSWPGADVFPGVPEPDAGLWTAFRVSTLDETTTGVPLGLTIDAFADADPCGFAFGFGESPDVSLGTPSAAYSTYFARVYAARRACSPWVEPAPAPFVARVTVIDTRDGSVIERHRLEIPGERSTEDAASVITAATVSNPSPAVGEMFVLHVEGETTTDGLFAFTPFSTASFNAFSVREVSLRLTFTDADTGEPLPACLDRACSYAPWYIVDHQGAAYFPVGSRVRWTADVGLTWTVYAGTDTPITPMVWTEDAGGLHHSARDATWRSFGLLPPVPLP